MIQHINASASIAEMESDHLSTLTGTSFDGDELDSAAAVHWLPNFRDHAEFGIKQKKFPCYSQSFLAASRDTFMLILAYSKALLYTIISSIIYLLVYLNGNFDIEITLINFITGIYPIHFEGLYTSQLA